MVRQGDVIEVNERCLHVIVSVNFNKDRSIIWGSDNSGTGVGRQEVYSPEGRDGGTVMSSSSLSMTVTSCDATRTARPLFARLRLGEGIGRSSSLVRSTTLFDGPG